jgi:ubiquinone/menaquinone biosynthesis C-methylase UbiE
MNEGELWNEKYPTDEAHLKAILATFDSGINNHSTLQHVIARIKPGNTILEIGSGTGQYSVYIAKHYSVASFAVDYSSQAVASVRALAHYAGVSIQAQQANIERLPFGDATFDIVFGDQVIAHVDDKQKAMREIARVLKPGGHVILNGGNALRFDGWALYHALTKKKYRQQSFFPWVLRALFTRVGLQPINSYGEILILTRNFSIIKKILFKKSVQLKTTQESPTEHKKEVTIVPKTPSRTRKQLKNVYHATEKLTPSWLKVTYGIIAKKG